MNRAPARKLPRAADVARLAGVSTATVDRVLHQRSGVRTATSQRVLQAAADLHYLPQAGLLQALAPAPMPLRFVIPGQDNRYLRILGDWVRYSRSQWAPLNVACRLGVVPSFDVDALVRALQRCRRDCQGVAFVAIDDPRVRAAVADLAGRGVHTVTLISDLPHSARSAYVGLENRATGRTVADLIARFVGPKRRAQVALIAGSLSYVAHAERETGFLDLLAERYPQMRVVGLREGYDDEAMNFRQARALLEAHRDLAAIYNIGGASAGIGEALKASGRAADVVFIGHGLTPDTRAMLIDGTMDAVINQSPPSTILNAVRIFTNLRERREPLTGIEITRSQVLFRENLP